MQSFMPTRFFVFKIQAIKNGFACPKSFQGFRETGPRPDQFLFTWNHFIIFETGPGVYAGPF